MSSTTSLGRSRPRAAIESAPATTEPPISRNAPVTWRKRSHEYWLTGKRTISPARDGKMVAMDDRERHLRLLTDTIAAVNASLDLEEVLELVATRVPGA